MRSNPLQQSWRRLPGGGARRGRALLREERQQPSQQRAAGLGLLSCRATIFKIRVGDSD